MPQGRDDQAFLDFTRNHRRGAGSTALEHGLAGIQPQLASQFFRLG
jgi:hypothetical protein